MHAGEDFRFALDLDADVLSSKASASLGGLLPHPALQIPLHAHRWPSSFSSVEVTLTSAFSIHSRTV